MIISIGNDHTAVKHKFEIIKFLESKRHQVVNFGTDTTESIDYPDTIHPASESVEIGNSDLGIVLCGTGNGAQMTANKHKGIRAALCWNNESVALAKKHNNANILAIPARFVSIKQALEFVDIFLTTEFEGGRHQARIDKISLD